MISIEKNRVLKGLLKQIEELESNKELSTPGGRTLKQQIKSHLDTEDEWMFFKHHFEEVHPDFFKNYVPFIPIYRKMNYAYVHMYAPVWKQNKLHRCFPFYLKQ